MYRNRCFVVCFVFCFVCEITGESDQKCNLMEACTLAISGDRNFVMVLIQFIWKNSMVTSVIAKYKLVVGV